MRAGIILLTAALAAGCAPREPLPDWTSGPVDPASGKLTAFWVVKAAGDKPVPVRRSYAMLIIWDEGVQRFHLYDNRARSYFATADFGRFLAEIERLPAWITVGWIDTCTVSRSREMPSEAYDRLEQALGKGHRRTDAEDADRPVVCYCESKGFRWLDLTTPAAATQPAKRSDDGADELAARPERPFVMPDRRRATERGSIATESAGDGR